jgi:hypothetical protein
MRLSALQSLSLRAVAAASALALMVSGAAFAGMSAPATAGIEQAAGAPLDGRAVAAREAKDSGGAVEILDERTESTQTFANPNGSFELRAFSGPVWVKDADDAWVDLNTTLEVRDGSVVPRAVPVDLRLSNGGAAGSPLATVGTDAKSLDGAAATMRSGRGSDESQVTSNLQMVSEPAASLGVEWVGALPAPSLDGNVATYAEVRSGIDLQVKALARGFQTFLIVKNAAAGVALGELDIPLALDDVELEAAAGGSRLVAGDGERVGQLGQVVAWDAAADSGAGDDRTAAVFTSTVRTPSSDPTLRIDVPSDYFTAEGREFPVTIDPSGTIGASADTRVSSGFPTLNYGTNTSLQVGMNTSGHKQRSFMYFPTSSIENTHVTAASLHLFGHDSASCAPTQIDVRKLTSSFSESTATWNNQPSYDASNSGVAGSVSDANGHSSSCGADWIGGHSHGQGVPVTSLVNEWSMGTSTNYGIALTADESSSAAWKGFRPVDHPYETLRPFLRVTYNQLPTTPTNLTVNPGVESGTATMVPAQPTLSADVSDPDGATVMAKFYIFDGATSLGAFNGSTVQGSGTSSWTALPGQLVTGKTYTIYAKGWDGLDTSMAQSTSESIKVDPSYAPPSMPTGVSVAPGDSHASVSWDEPQSMGFSSIAGYTVVANPGGVTTNTAGSAREAIVAGLTNGTPYTFTVRAVNAAGPGGAATVAGVEPMNGPSAPRSVAATPGDTKVRLAWLSPIDDDGSEVLSYRLRAMPGNNEVQVSAESTSAEFTGLSNGTAYTFTIESISASGIGAPSMPTAPVMVVAPPGKPTGVMNTPITMQGTTSVSWTPPTDTGGVPLEAYLVETTDGTSQAEVDASTSTVVLEGLEPATAYIFAVSASNGYLTGKPSAVDPVLEEQLQEQAELHEVADRIDGGDSASDPSGLDNYAGMVVDTDNDKLDVYWKGTVPQEVVDRAGQAPAGLSINFVTSATYTRSELEDEAVELLEPDGSAFVAIPDTPTTVVPASVVISSVATREEGDGLEVSYTLTDGSLPDHADAAPETVAEAVESLVDGVPVTADAVEAPQVQATSRDNDIGYFRNGGARIRTPKAAHCTSAFAVASRDPAQPKNGSLITAAHCGPNGGKYQTVTSNGLNVLGQSSAGGYTPDVRNDLDMAKIRLNAALWGGNSFYFGGIKTEIRKPVSWFPGSSRGAYKPRKGDVLCFSGSYTGKHCNLRVASVNVPAIEYSGRCASCPPVNNLVRVEPVGSPNQVVVGKGDSGGPVVFTSGGRYYAAGVISGGRREVPCGSNDRSSNCYSVGFFVPMPSVTTTFNVNLTVWGG